ncbi:MAG: DUF6272 family protein [Bacteroidales bacterium]
MQLYFRGKSKGAGRKTDEDQPFPPEEIKELYKDILNHQEITEKGLGGLGLLDIARKTGHRIDFRFKKYDNLNTAFRLSAVVAPV